MEDPRVLSIFLGLAAIQVGWHLMQALVEQDRKVSGQVCFAALLYMGGLFVIQGVVVSYPPTWSWAGVTVLWAEYLGMLIVPVVFALIGLAITPKSSVGYIAVLVIFSGFMFYGIAKQNNGKRVLDMSEAEISAIPEYRLLVRRGLSPLAARKVLSEDPPVFLPQWREARFSTPLPPEPPKPAYNVLQDDKYKSYFDTIEYLQRRISGNQKGSGEDLSKNHSSPPPQLPSPAEPPKPTESQKPQLQEWRPGSGIYYHVEPATPEIEKQNAKARQDVLENTPEFQ